ncbi:hypothetical protein BH24ACT9_BH24ACT9_10000 [soil metagenome]
MLATTAWQLVAGGLLLVPVALLVEGPLPATLSTSNLVGYGYLTIVGAALAYPLFFMGLRALSATSVTLLGLLSPVVATALGWLVLDQELTAAQALGGLVVLAAIVAAQTWAPRIARPTRQKTMRITVFGAAGNVGSRVVSEAVARGHDVTAVVRKGSRFGELHTSVTARTGDAGNVEDVAALSAGQDVVIAATRPAPGRESEFVITTKALLTGLADTGVRLLVAGRCGQLDRAGVGRQDVARGTGFPGRTVRHRAGRRRAARRLSGRVRGGLGILEPGRPDGTRRTHRQVPAGYRRTAGRCRGKLDDLRAAPRGGAAGRGRATGASPDQVHRRVLTSLRLRAVGSLPGMRVLEIWRYPVKSLRGERLDEAMVGAEGVEGDRRYAIFDVGTGFGLTARRAPELLFAAARLHPDGTAEITLPDGSIAVDDAALSGWLGREVVLRSTEQVTQRRFENPADFENEATSQWEPFAGSTGAFQDSGNAAVSLLSRPSIRDWEQQRFRANILLDEAGENELVGTCIRLGEAILEVRKQLERCVMTTRPQPGGIAKNLDLLRTIHRELGGCLAIGAVVLEAGRVRTGDALVPHSDLA